MRIYCFGIATHFLLLSLYLFLPSVANAMPTAGAAISCSAESVAEHRPAANSASSTVINNVPAYQWYHGCGPTAAASVIGYWDQAGFKNLFDANGDDLFLTDNVKHQISSDAHNIKYDPTPDALGPIPPATSIADWFETSVDPLRFGWSYVSKADDAITGYSDYRGYQIDAETKRYGSAFNWTNLVEEIDAKRPLLFTVDTDGDGGTDHFVPVLGYDDRGIGGRYYGLYTTWSESESVLWKPFQAMGAPWGVGYATVITPLPFLSLQQ